MKIIVCGSMSASKEMVAVEEQLQARGYEAILPEFTHDYAAMATIDQAHTESARNKVQHNLIRLHFDKIKVGDAILVVNVERHNIAGYIGGNTFLEMGFAFVLDKPIYLLYQIPEASYRDEIEAMRPIMLSGDINKIDL
jgi:nucleoside 2-deoxyribosyltransferase